VLNIPPVQQWIGGELSARQIRDVRIEDLLGQGEPYNLKAKLVSSPEFLNKVVLVTGAAGSIGSELVRQLLTIESIEISDT
jgi:FlaA1/EpsC-like NDP-sugar epimerase